MRFADIPFHNHAKQHLVQMVDEGRMPHALLIAGSEGIGKLAMARALAQYMQCQNRKDGDSCGQCPSCLQHQSLNHADMHFVYPVLKSKPENLFISEDYIAQWRKFLPENKYATLQEWLKAIDAENKRPVMYVEEAAHISSVANLTSYSSPVKIVLIWLPERMMPEAANKLLKIIEEPWEDMQFIMVSNDSSQILPTIFSRTQRVNLPRLSEDEISSMLRTEYSVDEAQSRVIARLADGSASTAIAALDTQGENEEFATIFRDVMRRAYTSDARALLQISETVASMGREKNIRLLGYFSRQIRENFIYNMSMPQLNRLTPEESNFSRNFAPFIHAGNVENLLAEVDAASNDIGRNASGKIVMFDMLLRFARFVKNRI